VTLRLEALRAGHDLTSFQSGNAELDVWLRDHAGAATGHGTRTYVLVDDADVVGYFSVVPHVLDRVDAPRRLARGAPQQIPAILLAKLALHQRVQGQGLGSELLVRALATILDAARAAGGRVVIVDAIDDPAAAFYRHHGFEALPQRADRLVMKLSTAARALDLDWP
jgi:GNAT superfamily N-acetyltransferase